MYSILSEEDNSNEEDSNYSNDNFESSYEDYDVEGNMIILVSFYDYSPLKDAKCVENEKHVPMKNLFLMKIFQNLYFFARINRIASDCLCVPVKLLQLCPHSPLMHRVFK